jgi:hypothetical protein
MEPTALDALPPEPRPLEPDEPLSVQALPMLKEQDPKVPAQPSAAVVVKPAPKRRLVAPRAAPAPPPAPTPKRKVVDDGF